jgi:hypothetical protein
MKHDYRADPILGGALAYWRAKRSGRTMPSRRDIDPSEIPKLLPHLQLIDVVHDRFRYRLIGTALVDAYGRNYTGQFVDELFDKSRSEFISKIYSSVVETRRPGFLRSGYVTTKGVKLVANRLYLPLSEDDRELNMILGAATFEFDTLGSVAGAWGSARLATTGSELEMVDPDAH